MKFNLLSKAKQFINYEGAKAFAMSLLASASAHIRHRKPRNTNFTQRDLNLIQLQRPDNGLYFLQRSVTPML